MHFNCHCEERKRRSNLDRFAVLAMTILMLILAACGKTEDSRPSADAPFSRGPSAPPYISEPTQPVPK